MSLSMQVESRTFWRRIDYNLLVVILTLNFVGLINLYSASHHAGADGLSPFFSQQMAWITAGWLIFTGLTFVDYKIFFRLAWPIYIVNLLSLAAVPYIGKVYYGAQRWLDFGFFRYQPSETMKIALVIILARYLSKNLGQVDGYGLKNLLVPGVLTLIPFALTVEQPDLGTALLIAAIAATMLLFVKVKTKIVISCLVLAAIAVPIAWEFGLKDYQKNRVLNFLSPGRDPRGTGYNSIQSKIAVGSGKVLGKGFRKGTQSQLEFLPERHTDFIFSVLSEEHGFIGSLTTIALFTVLFVMGIRISSQARERFGALLVVGLLSVIFWHFAVNIGMVIGILPIVGLPLPLISYGGSSLLTTMAALGLISSVAYRKYLF